MAKYFLICIAVLIIASCAHVQQDQKAMNVSYEQVCLLAENIGILGEPLSLAVVDETHFVVSDLSNNVYLYDFTGNQICRIGNSGRASFEYIFPMNVRAYKDNIYVWSANTGRFIEYTVAGEPVAEYSYQSAIRDFLPTEKKIYIYNAGLNDGSVIDVYDKLTQTVECSLSSTSDVHKLMLSWMAVSPMVYTGKELYYASKDALTLMKYSEDNGDTDICAEIQSESFTVDRLSNPNLPLKSKKARQYMVDNDMVLMISLADDGYYIFTREGDKKANKEGDDAYEDMYIAVYGVNRDGDSRHIANYSYSSFGSVALFSIFGSDIYYLKHSMDSGEDVYSLRRLIIHE